VLIPVQSHVPGALLLLETLAYLNCTAKIDSYDLVIPVTRLQSLLYFEFNPWPMQGIPWCVPLHLRVFRLRSSSSAVGQWPR
jgi:hypothetical protein